MEHKLIQGGEQYLPFARSRIKALRTTGLQYANQRFDMGDAQVEVRYALDQEYITISGGTGGWVAYPVYFDYRTSEINNVRGTLTPLPPSAPAPAYPPFPPEPQYPPKPVGSPPENPKYTYADQAAAVIYTFADGTLWTVSDGVKEMRKEDARIKGRTYVNFDYYWFIPAHFFAWLEYHGRATNMYQESDLFAFNAEVASNVAMQEEFGAALRAYRAWHAAVWPPYLDAVEAVKYKYWYITVPAWIRSHSRITSVGIAANREREMGIARDGQLAVLRAELDAGALTRYVAGAVVPPPITPRVRLAAPFPIKLTKSDGAPYSGNYTFHFEVTDYTTDPHEVRVVDGSIVGAGGRDLLEMTNICGTVELLEAVEALGGAFLRGDVERALAAATGGVAGKYSFGCFASGRFTQGTPPFSPSKSTITLVVPPEYKRYIRLGTTGASAGETITSDIYVMPKTVLLIAHIEYQHFDRHTGRMEWVPKAPAAGFAPAYEPSDIDAMGSDITNINPFFRWGDAVAIRVRGVTRQVYGDDRTWSSPVVSAPDFERTLLPHDNLLIRSFPDAIVILSKLPAQTVPPFPGGDLTYASVCKSRLAGDNGLRNLLTAGWSGDMSEDSWVDRLVMEVLKLTGTYKAAPP